MTADCQVAANKRIITVGQCAVITNQILGCGINKIMYDVINNKVLLSEAERRTNIIRTAADDWFNACKRRVKPF